MRSTKQKNKERSGSAARRRKGTECRFCGLNAHGYCSCGEGPVKTDRDLYAKLKEVVAANERHREINEHHWRTSCPGNADLLPRWRAEIARLEQSI